jgi:thiamine-monophosphate kinase
MMNASGVSAKINLDLVPLSDAAAAAIAADESLFETAMTGGDDYELLVSVRPDATARFEAAAAQAGIRVTQIGHAVAGQGAPQMMRSGSAISFKRGSFSHF